MNADRLYQVASGRVWMRMEGGRKVFFNSFGIIYLETTGSHNIGSIAGNLMNPHNINNKEILTMVMDMQKDRG